MSLLKRILVVILSTAIGRGLVFAFGLDQKAASMIRAVVTPEFKAALPWLLAGAIGLIGLGIWEVRPKWLQRSRPVVPDMPIIEGLNYIVNDSIWKPSETPPIRQFQIRGQTLASHPQGWRHQMALTELGGKIVAGAIVVWGRREFMPPTIQRSFDEILREIEQEYWGKAYLHPLHCFSNTRALEQTAFVNFNPQTDPHYTRLMVSAVQLVAAWPRRSLLLRIWERYVRRKPRLTYWAIPQL